jgi:hypothetical protein
MTIRIAPRLITRAVQGIRLALFANIAILAVVDIAIAVLALVALWAWSALTEGAQS